MRRLTEPQAHRGRAAVIDGRYPEGMQARCVLCGKSQPIEKGKLVAGRARPNEPVRHFLCSNCVKLLPAEGEAA